MALRGAVRQPASGRRHRAQGGALGRGLPRPGAGNGDRSYRDGRRPRGLRARQVAGVARPQPGRRGRALLRQLRLAPRPVDRRGRRPDRRRPRRARLPGRGRDARPRLRPLLALRHADHLPPLRRLVHRGRRHPPEAPRRERQGRVGARVHGQAHGRLAAQHGRLEHLAAPVLRPAAAVLSVLVRAPERDRVEGRARRARGRGPRPAPGAAPAVDRPRADPLRGLRRAGHARDRGRRRLARRGHRPVLDPRLAEPRVGRAGLRDRRREGPDDGRPARQRVLGEVVPGRLGQRDARADPALVLLAVLHVGRARRPLAIQARARLREDARRARARDARLVGEHDRCRGRVRPHGGRRDALAVLRAAAGPEPALRLRAGARDHPQAADLLALGQVLRRLREHRRLRARAGRSRGHRRRPDAARPLARRADARARPRGRGRVRGDADRERDARLRRVRRRPVELVHPPLAPPVLRATTRPHFGRSGMPSRSRCG